MTQYIYCPCMICITFSPQGFPTFHLHQAFAGELVAGLQLLGEGAYCGTIIKAPFLLWVLPSGELT